MLYKILIRSLKNSAPASPLVTLGNSHKKVLRSLKEIFGKATSLEESPRVSIEEAYGEKLQQAKHAKNSIKNLTN